MLVVIAGLVVAPGTATAADSIYWTTFSGKIRVGHLNGSGTPANVFPTTESVPDGVAVNPSTGKIYWANDTGGKIRVGNLNGSGTPSDLFSTTEDHPSGVAIDPAAGKIYWGDVNSGTIRLGNLNGSGTPTDLYSTSAVDNPAGVAIDPAAGKIYWANSNSYSTIRVANLNGSGAPADLFSAENLPQGVAIDRAAGKIYWVSHDTAKIRVANLNGSGTPKNLFSTAEDAEAGLAIDPAAGKIYWASHSKIRVGNLAGTGTPKDLFPKSEMGPFFLALLRAPLGVAPPAVAGGSLAGASLSCSQGVWAADLLGAFLYRAPRSFAYQWIRDGAAIPGATASSYKATRGGKYRCRISASNAAGTSPQMSPPHPVRPPKPKITKTKINHLDGSARFSFRSKGASGFQCSLLQPKQKNTKSVKPKFSKCHSPKAYTTLKPGKYTFEVRVRSTAGPGPAAKKRFTT